MLVVFCGGVVIGMIFGNEFFETGIVSEEYYLVVFGVESGIDIFLSRIANNLFLCLIFSTTFLSPYFLILAFFALFYRGFVFGMALTSIITTLGGAGVLLSIFLVIPTQVLLHFVLLSLSLFGLKSSDGCCLKTYIPSLFMFYAMTCLIALVEIAMIYLIIRPLTMVL